MNIEESIKKLMFWTRFIVQENWDRLNIILGLK